jgi:hypothetical protein
MYFPVLQSKAIAMFPATRLMESHHVEEVTPGGFLWRNSPAIPVRRKWLLRFEGLTDTEADALQSFYASCMGGWKTFRFADPMANLLRWSEDLTHPVWGKDTWITVAHVGGGSGQPHEFQIVNTGAGPGTLWQELDLAPGADLCFSCEVRTGAVRLRIRDILSSHSSADAWQRAIVSAESSGGPQRLAIELEPGASAVVRKAQAETQRAPSEYQGTYERGGIHLVTRFVDSGLAVVSAGPNQHSAEVLLESLGEAD